MASSFSSNLGVEIMASGEKSGTWGDITNFNLNIVDRLVSLGDLSLENSKVSYDIKTQRGKVIFEKNQLI